MRPRAGLFFSSALIAGALLAAGKRDLKTLDLCRLVPGAEVARAAGGELVEAKRWNASDGTLARCVYQVHPAGREAAARQAWVLELHPESTFTELRPYVEPTVHDLAGLGDGAWTYRDPDSGRTRIYVLKRGDATLGVDGEDETKLRAVAATAFAEL